MSGIQRTLVVDDEDGIRFFLRETLERMGHIVTEAANGEAALDCLKDTAFDLAILDLKLGGPVDGQRVLESIRWRWPTIVMIGVWRILENLLKMFLAERTQAQRRKQILLGGSRVYLPREMAWKLH